MVKEKLLRMNHNLLIIFIYVNKWVFDEGGIFHLWCFTRYKENRQFITKDKELMNKKTCIFMVILSRNALK